MGSTYTVVAATTESNTVQVKEPYKWKSCVDEYTKIDQGISFYSTSSKHDTNIKSIPAKHAITALHILHLNAWI